MPAVGLIYGGTAFQACVLGSLLAQVWFKRSNRVGRVAMALCARQTVYTSELLRSAVVAPISMFESIGPKGVTEMTSSPDESSFVAMLALSGMQVPQDQLPSLFEGYRHMMRQIDLLGRPTTLAAEPAVIFIPEQR